MDIENTKNALVKKGFIVSKKTLHWSRRNAKNELANYSFFVFDELQIILRHLNQTKFVHK